MFTSSYLDYTYHS